MLNDRIASTGTGAHPYRLGCRLRGLCMHAKINKQLFAFFLAVLLVVAAALPSEAETVKIRPLIYTALGDSIASGYKLSQNRNGYVSLFGSYLSAQTTNLARVGLDSAGLLKLLGSDQVMMDQVKKSDIVTISIGGNDLLPIFSALQPSSPASLVTAVQAISGSAMQQKFQAAVAHFGQNWDKIVAQVKKLAPHAQIVATTLVDPYEGMVISVPVVARFDLGSYADGYIRQINTVITGHAKSGQYAVADAYSLFMQHKTDKLTNADLSKLDFDPHPNAAGHRLLFQAHQAVALDLVQDALTLNGPAHIVIPADGKSNRAQFSVQPLLSCFTAAGASTQTVYTMEDTGTTGAAIDVVSGILYVYKPGTVRIKATLTTANGKLSAETTRTIHVTQALVTQAEWRQWAVPAGIVLVVLAGVLLILLLPRRKKHKPHGSPAGREKTPV